MPARLLRLALLGAALLLSACGPYLVWHGSSPDRRHRVQVWERRGRQFVRMDGRDGPRYPGIGVQHLTLSHDGRRLAYPARQGRAWSVVVDGSAGPRWDGIGALAFSPDGQRLAYAAARGSRWTVVFDGQPGAYFEGLLAGSLVFSPDGQRLAYGVRTGAGVAVVMDGQAGARYDGIAGLTFSADSRRSGYIARRGRSAFLVVDGVEQGPYQAIAEFAIGPAGCQALLAKQGHRWMAITPDGAGPPQDSVSRLILRPDGCQVAYVARRGAAEFVIRGGAQSPPYERVHRLVQSADGARWGYVVRQGGRARAVVDDEPGPAFDEVADLIFSPDGRRHAYLARLGREHLVVEGGQRHRFDLLVTGTLAYSRDGRSWGCAALAPETGQLYLVSGGRLLRRLDLDELTAALLRLPPPARLAAAQIGRVLGPWVAAELELPALSPVDRPGSAGPP